MKQGKNLLSIAVLVLFLVVSHTVHCEDSTVIELKSGEIYLNPVTNHYTTTFSFSISLIGGQEHTVYLSIPLDVEIHDVYMRLSPIEGEIPSDLTISLGDELIADLPGEFTGFECSTELRNSMEEYLKANQERGEYAIPVPLVFTSGQGGKIEFKELSVEYTITGVKELDSVSDPHTGIPKHFFWRLGAGPNPRYELQIRPEDFSSDSEEPLFAKSGIVGAFYKLTEEEIAGLELHLEPGKTYYWGVKVVYKVGESQWTTSEFTIGPGKPASPESIQLTVDTDEITFYWEDPGNVDYFIIALNGHLLESNLKQTFYSTEKTNTHLCPCGENTLTVWAVSGDEKSEPSEFSFILKVDRLNAPDNLFPNMMEHVKERYFFFKWSGVPGASAYEIELFDSGGSSIKLPYRNENGDMSEGRTIRVSSSTYDPWHYGDLELKSGEIYSWRVRAIPRLEDERMESEWAIQMFVYQPVLLRMLILFSAIGGLLGGFIRIAQQERVSARERGARMKLHLDLHVSIDLLVGLIVGIIFYLLINQTLGQQLNAFSVPPYGYVGSLILGFIGGLISYDLTRLKRALPE